MPASRPLAADRTRLEAGWLFAAPFRPFFLGASLYAAVAVPCSPWRSYSERPARRERDDWGRGLDPRPLPITPVQSNRPSSSISRNVPSMTVLAAQAKVRTRARSPQKRGAFDAQRQKATRNQAV